MIADGISMRVFKLIILFVAIGLQRAFWQRKQRQTGDPL